MLLVCLAYLPARAEALVRSILENLAGFLSLAAATSAAPHARALHRIERLIFHTLERYGDYLKWPR